MLLPDPSVHAGKTIDESVHDRKQDPVANLVYGSGWHAPLGYNAEPLKNTPLKRPYIRALCDGGCTVFAINHRATLLLHLRAGRRPACRTVCSTPCTAFRHRCQAG
jgi:hypothetical protein